MTVREFEHVGSRIGAMLVLVVAVSAIVAVFVLPAGPWASAVVEHAARPTPAVRVEPEEVALDSSIPERSCVPDEPVGGAAAIGPERTVAPVPTSQILAWIEDLRDDDVPDNATAACCELRRHFDAARPYLEQSLDSCDDQQRRFAVELLREGSLQPSARLLELSVRDLGTNSGSSSGAVRFLVDHVEEVRSDLEWGTRGSGKLRFLSAYLLAQAGFDGIGVRTPLIEHLADNQIHGDAIMASHALSRLGRSVLPSLREAHRGADEQARLLLTAVEHTVLDQQEPFDPTRRMRAVTWTYLNPARDYDVRRSPIPAW